MALPHRDDRVPRSSPTSAAGAGAHGAGRPGRLRQSPRAAGRSGSHRAASRRCPARRRRGASAPRAQAACGPSPARRVRAVARGGREHDRHKRQRGQGDLAASTRGARPRAGPHRHRRSGRLRGGRATRPGDRVARRGRAGGAPRRRRLGRRRRWRRRARGEPTDLRGTHAAAPLRQSQPARARAGRMSRRAPERRARRAGDTAERRPRRVRVGPRRDARRAHRRRAGRGRPGTPRTAPGGDSMRTAAAALLPSSISTVGGILATMAVVALLETVIPLHARGRWHGAHLGPNLALTFITFATNIVFNVALVMTLMRLRSAGLGVLHMFELPPLVTVLVAVLVLDFSFYVAHVAMHRIPSFWRFHRVHHSDPVVDVTTTIRQHPGEGVIRYAFMGAFAVALGASPGAFAVYRAWSALNGLLEHANVRVPLWLDSVLSLVTTWPNMHKVHHSRTAAETNRNYGNIFSIFDRLFFTFTPSERGASVSYGLDGFDDPAAQTTAGLLAMPFRDVSGTGGTAVAVRQLS